MFFDTLPDGELLLPVCIEAHEIHKMLSALEMYRVMVNGGENYPAFEAVLNAIDNMPNPQDSPCLDIESTASNVCWAIDTTNSAIRFHPNDPFISIDQQQRPPIGQWERWEDSLKRPPNWMQNLIGIADDLSFFNKNIGYFPNDCFVVAPEENANDVTQLFDTLNALRQADFPYIEIEVHGTGELELHLLKVPFGGSAIIVWDMEFDVWDFLWDLVNGGSSPSGNIIQTELEREILTLPPEANEENVIEIDFTEDSDHIVRIYFVPRFDYTALDFLGNGGGIREVSACDGLTLISPEGESITKKNFKLAEFHRKGFIMATTEEICVGVVCAMEKVAQRILLASQAENIENDVIIGARDDGSGYDTAIDKTSNIIAPEFETTSQELANGGAYHQAMQFKKAFDDLNANVTANWAEATLDKVLSFFLGLQTLATFGMITYKSDDPQVTIDVNLLTEQIYCSGSFQAGLFEYAAQNHNEDDFGWIVDLANEIPNTTLRQWYADGNNSPINNYLNYACYRQPMIEATIDFSEYTSSSTANLIFQQNTFANRNWRLELAGKYTDATGREYDGVFLNDNGLLTRNQVKIIKYQQADASASNQPNYSTDGYALTYSMPVKAPDGIWTQQAFVPVSGSITYKLHDLGAI